jgi:hypothetical protein
MVVYSQVTLPDYYFLLVLCLSHFILGILAAKFTEQPKRSLYVVISIIIFIILLECLHQSIWQTPLAYTLKKYCCYRRYHKQTNKIQTIVNA